MRFCQTDGTPLVEDATPADPYKTMVASKEDIQAALSSQPAGEAEPAGIGAPEEEPLELPATPPESTPASEFETKIAGRDEGQVIEIPPLAESIPPEPPKFNEPEAPPPSFGEHSAPPSPFSSSEPSAPGEFPTTPPIPSPFGASTPSSFEPSAPLASTNEPEPEEPTYFEPEPEPAREAEPEPAVSTSKYSEPERPAAQGFSPFEQKPEPSGGAVAQSQWTPPSPSSSSQNAPGGTSMSSPPPGTAGQNQTLAIVSLVTGIAGLTVCCGTFVVPLIGIVLGFMARSKANNDPIHYGGAGLAMGGIITGVLGLIGSIFVGIYVLLNFAYIMSQIR